MVALDYVFCTILPISFERHTNENSLFLNKILIPIPAIMPYVGINYPR